MNGYWYLMTTLILHNNIFIDLTKAFKIVRRRGLFILLPRIVCPPKLLIESFHEDTKAIALYTGSASEPFPSSSRVKQGGVLAPTLYRIFFSLLAFSQSDDGVYHHTRNNGNLFNLARHKAKTNSNPRNTMGLASSDVRRMALTQLGNTLKAQNCSRTVPFGPQGRLG